LTDASTARDSTRGDFVGTRSMWVRLLRPYEMNTGAQVEPLIAPRRIRRLYEFTVGHVTATIAGA
jgi:hypothetical protein